MAVEGRTHRPVVDHGRCSACAICRGGCPAGRVPELRAEPESLRGRIYGRAGAFEPQPLEDPDFPPPCRAACPLDQDVPGYVDLLAQGQVNEALKRILRTNPLPAVCGHICTRPCETACTRSGLDGPVPIRALKAFAASEGEVPEGPHPAADPGAPLVAVVGSGPAGLTAAHDLALAGLRVQLLESHDRPGGMLSWAIPSFRLPRKALEADLARILGLGVDLRTGILFGGEATLASLRNEGIRAVLLATGTMKSIPLRIPGEDAQGIIDCLGFLRHPHAAERAASGHRVLVVGGGNAAMDAARTAGKAGAGHVTVVYRRGPDHMPADPDEVREAEREGVEFRFLTAPVRVNPSPEGRVRSLTCLRTELMETGEDGRPRPVPVNGTEHDLEGDVVITAVGQSADLAPLLTGLGLQDTQGVSLEHESHPLVAGRDPVVAAGDLLNGPTSVVEAMASGRRAARALAAALSVNERI